MNAPVALALETARAAVAAPSAQLPPLERRWSLRRAGTAAGAAAELQSALGLPEAL